MPANALDSASSVRSGDLAGSEQSVWEQSHLSRLIIARKQKPCVRERVLSFKWRDTRSNLPFVTYSPDLSGGLQSSMPDSGSRGKSAPRTEVGIARYSDALGGEPLALSGGRRSAHICSREAKQFHVDPFIT